MANTLRKPPALGWRPKVVSSERGLSSRNARTRSFSCALNYVAELVDSAVSWCAATSPRGTPDLNVPIIIRVSGDRWINGERYVDDYWWLGMSVDPFRFGAANDPKSTVQGPDDLHIGKFARHPFTLRFLNRHGMGTRTVIYLRDRGRNEAVIALDREIGRPTVNTTEKVALVKVAPLLGQMIGMASQIIGPAPKKGPGPPLSSVSGLTEREAQVAAMVGQGLSNDEIAGELTLSTGTVKVHLGHIYRKTGVRTRAQLVSLVLSGSETSGPVHLRRRPGAGW